MGWVSWPLYIFVFLAPFSALWWPNIWLKWGFRNFLKKLLVPFITCLAFILMGWVSWPLYIYVFLVSFLKNSHLCITRLQNQNLYWIFLDEVGSDQSGGILSPFMGTTCLNIKFIKFHGIPWNFKKVPWNSMKYFSVKLEVPWNSMEFHGAREYGKGSMEFHGTLDLDKNPCNSMEL